MNGNGEIRIAITSIELLRRKMLRPLFLELGLTLGEGQPRVLDRLLEKDCSSQSELAEGCRIDTTTLSRTLDHMERAGLIERRSDPKCRRARVVSLTENGVEKAKAVHEIFSRFDCCICEALSEQEGQSLLKLLLKVERHLAEK